MFLAFGKACMKRHSGEPASLEQVHLLYPLPSGDLPIGLARAVNGTIIALSCTEVPCIDDLRTTGLGALMILPEGKA